MFFLLSAPFFSLSLCSVATSFHTISRRATCQLLVWHGLYQHPQAEDKNQWFVYPEHAIAAAEKDAINPWSILGSVPSYTSDFIKREIESEQSIADKDKVHLVCCWYECSNYFNPEDGETCIMIFAAEDGPTIEGYGMICVDYIGIFHAESRKYVWHPRTAMDEALERRYFYRLLSQAQEELNSICCEGVLYRLDT